MEFDIKETIQILKKLREDEKLGSTTQTLVDEATARVYPEFCTAWLREISKEDSGQATSETFALAIEIADEKARTKELLKNACIPVPDGMKVTSFDDALDAAEDLWYSVVIKPEVGNHGRGITVNIKT